MIEDFVLCARAVEKSKFSNEPGVTRFLQVPAGQLPSPKDEVSKKDAWVKCLRKEATWGKDLRTGLDRGDILFFVHGYNNDQRTVMDRHRQIKVDLSAAGWKGAIVSFDWPSADMALNYLEDRHDAKQTALQLVTDGITLLAEQQGPDCTINLHLLGHSTGAYVIREAFDDADDAKRVGMAPRVGRVGLPSDMPSKAVDIDCSEYFQLLESQPSVRQKDQKAEIGAFDHSWHIGNTTFTKDLCETLKGDLDRNIVPTRKLDGDGKLWLIQA